MPTKLTWREKLAKRIANKLPLTVLMWAVVRAVGIASKRNPGIHVDDLGYSKLWNAIHEEK